MLGVIATRPRSLAAKTSTRALPSNVLRSKRDEVNSSFVYNTNISLAMYGRMGSMHAFKNLEHVHRLWKWIMKRNARTACIWTAECLFSDDRFSLQSMQHWHLSTLHHHSFVPASNHWLISFRCCINDFWTASKLVYIDSGDTHFSWFPYIFLSEQREI